MRRGDDPQGSGCNASASVCRLAFGMERSELPLRRSGESPADLGPSVEVRVPVVVRVSPRPILTGHGLLRRRGTSDPGKMFAAEFGPTGAISASNLPVRQHDPPLRARLGIPRQRHPQVRPPHPRAHRH